MNRGPWQATVHGVTRVRQDLAPKPPPPPPPPPPQWRVKAEADLVLFSSY